MKEVSGNACRNGIVLYTDDVKVKCYYTSDGKIKTKITKNSINNPNSNEIKNKLLKIPFIRGIIRIANLILLLAFIGIDICEKLKSINSTSKDNDLFSYILFFISLIILIICICVLGYFIKNVKSFLRFHGAEHKVINTYENNKSITIENIIKSSRISLDCGTIFATFLVVFMFLFFVIIPYKTIAYLLAISISYELFRVDNPNCHWYSKYFYKFGEFFQKYVTTLEPSERELIIAKECMNQLLKSHVIKERR